VPLLYVSVTYVCLVCYFIQRAQKLTESWLKVGSKLAKVGSFCALFENTRGYPRLSEVTLRVG